VFIAPSTAAFGVISDIDDTVVYTGVANKLKMLWRLFFSKAEIRAIYIRDVGSAPGRRRSIAQLARAAAQSGATLMLAADSVAMATHAARQRLISTEMDAQVIAAQRDAV
jgi:phosphatidate phosphatase APP1